MNETKEMPRGAPVKKKSMHKGAEKKGHVIIRKFVGKNTYPMRKVGFAVDHEVI